MDLVPDLKRVSFENDAVIGIDTVETVTYFNAAAERLYGVPADKIIGKPLGLLYAYEWLRDTDHKRAMEALAKDGEWKGENVHVFSTGRRLHVRSHVLAMRDSWGKVTGYMAAIRPIQSNSN